MAVLLILGSNVLYNMRCEMVERLATGMLKGSSISAFDFCLRFQSRSLGPTPHVSFEFAPVSGQPLSISSYRDVTVFERPKCFSHFTLRRAKCFLFTVGMASASANYASRGNFLQELMQVRHHHLKDSSSQASQSNSLRSA